MAAFSLADALNLKPVAKLDTAEMKEIKVSLLDPNPNNFFPVEEDITDLYESIKLNGLLQPPVVTPAEGGRYRIIAGHRRHKALQTLAEELPDKFGAVLCRVVRPSSPQLEELMLIQTNTEARKLGPSEINKSAERVEKILIELQKQGMELPGKMRKHVANILKTSESQLARAKYISEHLIKDFEGSKFLNGSEAYALAHLPEDQQKELYQHYKGNLWNLTNSAIKRYQENLQAGRDPFYVPPPPPRDCLEQKKDESGKYKTCTHETVIDARKKKKLPKWQKCERSCCKYCTCRFDCEDVCPIVKKQAQEHLKSPNGQICQAIRAARENAGLSLKEAALAMKSDISSVYSAETNKIHTAISLAEYAKTYATTPNELLGFDASVPTTATGSFPQWIPADQIDDLPDGFYTLAYCYRENTTNGEEGLPLIHTRLALLEGDHWYSAMGKIQLCFSAVSKEVLVAVAPACIAAPTGFTFFLGGATDDGM